MSETISVAAAAVTADDLRRWAGSPMEFFQDCIVPGVGVRLGDVWADFQQDAFRTLARCILAVATGEKPPYRGIWIERTKGASKDSDIGLALLWLLMFARTPQSIELGADDFDQIGETRKAMVAILRCNPWMAGRVAVRTEKIVCEATSSEALFLHGSRTVAATGSHGSRPTVTVCNELSHCSSEEFISTMMDNADKVSGNLAIIATNAGELSTWQHRWRENYRTDPAWWFQAVTDPAPWIDGAKVADAERRNSPSRFARLWKGIWSSPGGDFLNAAQIARAVLHDSPVFSRHTPATFPCCGLGVDLASGGKHHAAIVVLLGDRFGKLRVARVVDYPPPVSISVVKQRIEYLGDAYRCRALFSDSWGASLLSEQLGETGWDVELGAATSNAAKVQQAASLVQVFQDEILELYDDGSGDGAAGLLLADLQNCRLIEKPFGSVIELEENENGHSDRLAALLQIIPPMLRAMGTMPMDAGGTGAGRGDEEEEVIDTRPEWERKALRLTWGGWQYRNRR